jgi:hypothetical protein
MGNELYNFCEACEERAGLYENCNAHARNGPQKKNLVKKLDLYKSKKNCQNSRKLEDYLNS